MGIATYAYNRSTSGGEIITHLINSTDGAGLHFDGTSGNIDIASPPDLGTKFSFELVLQADEFGSQQINFIDFGSSGRFALTSPSANGWNLGIYDGTHKDFGVKVLDDLKVHHLCVTVDGTAATLYDNGNQVGSATIAAPTIDLAADARIGSKYNGGSGFFNGTIYRARLWNKTLSPAEITSVYESASLDFADQWGSETVLISVVTGLDGWDAYTNWYSQTTTGSDMVLVASAADQSCRTAVTLTAGKRYRCTYTASSVTDAPAFKYDVSGVWTALTVDVGSSTITAGTNTLEFVWPAASTNDYFYILSDSTSTAVTLNNLSVVRAGCVADYDLAFANPTQSLMVQDRAGAADGTASAGVEQVTKIEAVNTNKLNVGGTTPLVGIGLAAGVTPEAALDVNSTVTGGAGTVYGAIIRGTEAAGANLQIGDGIGLKFEVPNNNAESRIGASIEAIKESGGDDSSFTSLLFKTSQDDETLDTALTIDSGGDVGIGTSSPDRLLELENATNPALRLNNGNSNADIGIASSAGAILTGAADDDLVIARNGAYGIAVGTNGTTRLTIDSAGNVGVGGTPVSAASVARFLYVGDTSSAGIVLDDTNSTPWDIYNVQGDLYFSPNGGASALTITGSSGLATFSAGINVSAGNVTLPAQPAFSVTPATNQNNIATDTSVDIVLATEIFDQGANFASNTFTAPVAGRYQFNATVAMNYLDSAADFYQINLVTSNRTYSYTIDPDFGQDATYWEIGNSFLADMDASDTAKLQIYQSSGTQQTDIVAARTFFTGFLAC
tara:strand:- start:364 stop:2721 length:2358 start_codon:yes stop_codon:yes gene_type:complete